jgi:hypothetical protein
MKILMDIGQEQQFEVTFVDIDDKTDDGQVQFLVQLSMLPVNKCSVDKFSILSL